MWWNEFMVPINEQFSDQVKESSTVTADSYDGFVLPHNRSLELESTIQNVGLGIKTPIQMFGLNPSPLSNDQFSFTSYNETSGLDPIT
jgi:hypothetical protein